MFVKTAVAVVLMAPLLATDANMPNSGLTVHEWGTFTSVADEDGSAVPWVSLQPPADLPSFVYHLSEQCIKCAVHKVRMETPVLYFYAKQPLTASVHVDLPTGLITEWYPRAVRKSGLEEGYTYGANGNIEWPSVQVSPGAAADFPNAGDRSHYYAARKTNSAPLRVGDETEKVLFYRGIASFFIGVQPKFLPDGKLQIRNWDRDPVGFGILFENRKGNIGYRTIRDLHEEVVLDPPDLTTNVEAVRGELAWALTSAGLYPKEAAAMIETWGDSWFEEGTRIFYVLPRKKVDEVLPIKIAPTPEDLERVFVGRIEVLSPAMQQSIETALTAGDTQALAKYGRFLSPFCTRLLHGRTNVQIAPAAAAFLEHARLEGR